MASSDGEELDCCRVAGEIYSCFATSLILIVFCLYTIPRVVLSPHVVSVVIFCQSIWISG